MLNFPLIPVSFLNDTPFILPFQTSSNKGLANANDTIIRVQDLYLIRCLGQSEKIEFEADIDPLTNEPTSQKWIKFLDGTTYECEGKQIHFSGFRNVLKSICFFEILNYNIKMESQNESNFADENNKKANIRSLVRTAHNDIIPIWGQASDLKNPLQDTLINYLKNNETDFVNAVFTILKFIY